MAYATTGQYVARYGQVANVALLQECLDDATAAIDSALDQARIDHEDPSDEFADRLMRVCRSMANRIYPSEGAAIPQGARSATVTAVGFSETYSFGASYGTPKLLPSERSMLGIGGSAGFARPSYGRLEKSDA